MAQALGHSRADDDFEYEDSEEDGEDEEIPTSKPKENAVYNSVAIHSGLDAIAWTHEADWLHTLSVTYANPSVENVDVNDDLARELAFYTQALDGTKEAFMRLHERGVPILRPKDYYAEMVKTDSHMLKVKEQLIAEKRRLEEMEERRKQREAKKYAKEVQAEKLQERAKQKKAEVEAVKNWRKERKKSGYSDDMDDFPIDLEDDEHPTFKRKPQLGDRSIPKGGQAARLASKKRQMKDSKFGFGGKKRLKKQNTADSAGEMVGFRGNIKEKSFDPKGGGRARKGFGAQKKGKKKPQRPGKTRRQQAKSKKR